MIINLAHFKDKVHMKPGGLFGRSARSAAESITAQGRLILETGQTLKL